MIQGRQYLLSTYYLHRIVLSTPFPLCFASEKSKTESTESQKSLQMNNPERQRKKCFLEYIWLEQGMHLLYICGPRTEHTRSAHNVHAANLYLLPSHPSAVPTPAQGNCHWPRANPKGSQSSRTLVLRAK